VHEVHNWRITTNVTTVDLGGATDERRETVAREIGTVVFAALVYFGVRLAVEGDTTTAVANADRILRFERWLGIDIEHPAQDLVLDSSALRLLGNASYVWLHWPLLIAVLVVLFRRDHAVYLRLRRAMVASGAAGLVLFALVPTAPPRFMPGFEGTVSDAARRHYLDYPLGWANRYASFPSFHVGWTLIACLALAATLPSVRARVIAVLPAVLVALAVVTTGNHYVVDAVVGVAIAATAYVVAGRFAGRVEPTMESLPAPAQPCQLPQRRRGALHRSPTHRRPRSKLPLRRDHRPERSPRSGGTRAHLERPIDPDG
jgi:hypothetical protein